jgi:Transferase family
MDLCISSWQACPLWDIDFGAGRMHSFIGGSGPFNSAYYAIVLPGNPGTGGGLDLTLMLPEAAARHYRGHKLLRRFLPNATFYEGNHKVSVNPKY